MSSAAGSLPCDSAMRVKSFVFSLVVRRSGRYVHGLEGVFVEHVRLGERRTVFVDHRNGLARGKQTATTRCVGTDFVEINDPKASEWVEGGRFVGV